MVRISPTTSLSYLGGIPPKQRQYDTGMSKMVSNDDVVVVVERANVTPAPTTSAWTYTVPFHLETAAGETIPFNGTIAATVTDNGGGTATVSSATPAVVNGRGTVNIIGDAATWASGEAATLTLTHTNLRGTTDADTFVVTFTTPE